MATYLHIIRSLGLGILIAVSLLLFAAPSANAADPAIAIPNGKTLKPNGQVCKAINPLTGMQDGSVALVLETGGFCQLQFTDGTQLTVEFSAGKQTQTGTLRDANGKTIGTPETKSWIEGAQEAVDQAAAATTAAEKSAVTAARAAVAAPSTGARNTPLSANEATALYKKVEYLSSRNLITIAERDKLNSIIFAAGTGGASQAQLDSVRKMGTAVDTLNANVGRSADVNTAAKEAASAQQETAAEAEKSCNIVSFNLGTCLQSIMWAIIKKIGLFFLYLAAFFAGFAGFLFNWIIYITVFQFGNLIGNNAGMLAAWGVLRDIGNLVLLFGFIFMGLSTILSLPGNEFTARRALPALIIFAILMNFSLFAAEAVIDTSNALGTTLYRQAANGMCGEGESMLTCVTQKGIGGRIMQITGIASIFSLDPDKEDVIANDDLGGAIEVIGLTIFAAVTAFVFLAAVFMLIARAIMLAFLMAVSPIGFAGMAIPPLHRYASMWWEQLLKQSFFAPIYILLVLISIKFMEGIIVALNAAAGAGSTTEVSTLASAFSRSGITNVSMVVNFMLITGFMLGAVIIAKSMGAAGASGATRMAGAVVFGGMARASNFGIGGASRLARLGVQRTLGKSDSAFVRGIGSGASAFLKGGEKLNTDLRGVAGKRGADLFGAPAQKASYDDVQNKIQEVREGIRANQATFDRDASLQRLRSEVGRKGGLSPESERFLATLSADEIAHDHDLEHKIGDLAPLLSASQFENLTRSDKVPQKLKDEARRERYAELKDAILNSRKGGIRKMTPKDLEQFFLSPIYAELKTENEEALKEFVTLMNGGQYDTLRASTVLTNAQRSEIKRWRDDDRFNFGEFNDLRSGKQVEFKQAISMDGNRKPLYVDPSTGRVTEDVTSVKATRIDRTLDDLNTADRAKLEDKILAREEVFTRLAPEDFAAIQRADKLEPPQRRAVSAHLNAVFNEKSARGDRFRAYRDTMSDNAWKSMKAFYQLSTDKAKTKRSKATTDDGSDDGTT